MSNIIRHYYYIVTLSLLAIATAVLLIFLSLSWIRSLHTVCTDHSALHQALHRDAHCEAPLQVELGTQNSPPHCHQGLEAPSYEPRGEKRRQVFTYNRV